MLLKPRPMNQEPSRWRRLTPATIAALPEAAAIFEVANLVRTVKYIGSAGGNLRARLSAFHTQAKLRPSPGGYFFRYEPATREDDVLARRGLRSEEHTSELQSQFQLVCRLPLQKK